MGKQSEEALLKRQQDALDEMAHLMERYANRLPFEPDRLSERYIESRLEICLKLRSRHNGQEGHIIISRSGLKDKTLVGNEGGRRVGLREVSGSRQTGQNRHQIGAILETDANNTASLEHGQPLRQAGRADVEWRDGESVFLVDVEVVKGAKVSIPSRMRLGFADQIDGAIREEIFYFFKRGTVRLWAFAEREANFVSSPSLPLGEDGKDVVQRITEVREDVANINEDAGRKLPFDLKISDLLASLKVHLGRDFIWVCRDKLLDVGLELVDSGFGPFGLCVAPAKRLRFHDPRSF